ncbi:MAG: viologen exporter family transport system permease protein [Thermococcaceae archaeon]|jgi:ABC-2 type transport system permease protein|uniref:ABC-2 family transporter protein n=1 Tax=Thermococcus TaxID=2263 RepID=UPI0005B28CBE|nr:MULTISPECIES: ABC-2 family transporter protein [Thermococcus]MDK2782535.1 viologen exporter family transport system permease protein [Thermococcaceae archaeon]MCA6213771.1 hypothetical protein [Thermococcus bergensis]MDK2983295.1 viologen exporter family transport system permease protein [Thermococcaceae archaeon]MDN5320713.1 viologen exporter family transport system permease protein [Thermococcaceae archaeon]MPW38395.1 hypothetical protein [Thermococcus sp. 101 C5]
MNRLSCVINVLLKSAVERVRLYKTDLALYLVAWCGFTALLMTFWTSVLANFEIVTFTRGEVLAFIGMYYIAWGIVSFFWGVRDLHVYIVDGTIDVYLTKPINPVFLVILTKSHAGVVLEILTGVILLLISIPLLPNPITTKNIFLSIIFLSGGVALYALIYGALSMLAFFVGRMEHTIELIDYAYEYTYYPLNFLPKGLRSILTWALPLAFLVTLPTLSLLGKLSTKKLIISIIGEGILLIVWFGIFVAVFKKGLEKYTSAGG